MNLANAAKRGGMLLLAAQLHAAPAPVEPFLDCIDASPEGPVAVFGYRNPNPFPVSLPLSEANRFTPERAYRGQPLTFVERANVQSAVRVPL